MSSDDSDGDKEDDTYSDTDSGRSEMENRDISNHNYTASQHDSVPNTGDALTQIQQQLKKQQALEKRGRERQRHRRDKKKRLRADIRRYDATLQDLRQARKALDDRMIVIDIAHQHSWDIARRYVENEWPVRNKHLREAIAEAKKEADSKKEKDFRHSC